MATFDTATGVIDGSISPSAFLRADTISPADGTTVSSVANTGGGTAWTQATGTRQPLFKTSIFGSKPALRFDGVDDFLTRTAGAAFNNGTCFLLFRVLAQITTATAVKNAFNHGSPSGGTVSGGVFGADTGGLTNELVTFHSATQTDRSAYTAAGATFNTATTYITTTRWNSGTTRFDIFQDGGANIQNAITGTPALLSSAVNTVAASPNVEFPVNMDVGAVVVYASVLTDAQKAAVHSWMKDVWGATAADYDASWVGPKAPPPISGIPPYRHLLVR